MACPTCPRAHVPCVPYVLLRRTCPTYSMCPTCPTLPRAQVYFTDQKIENYGFNEIKGRFIH